VIYVRWAAGVIAAAAAAVLTSSATSDVIPSDFLPYIGIAGTLAGIVTKSPIEVPPRKKKK